MSSIKEKNDKTKFGQNWNQRYLQSIFLKTERQDAVWEKIFTKPLSSKGLVSKIYKLNW